MSKLVKDILPDQSSSKCEKVAGIFVLAILGLFPLVYTDYYFNMLETKYYFFCICIIGALLACGIFALTGKSFNYDFKKTIKGFMIVDWAVIAFWTVSAISTLFSEYQYEAFWGNEGRYSGLFLITLYCAMYFLITRYFVFKPIYLDVFLGSSLLAGIFGITDYFNMDLLGFQADIATKQIGMFTSTFGNINSYTAYIVMALAVAAVLFATSQTYQRKIWYYVCSVVLFFAAIMGRSDNVYLAIMALFGFLPLFLFKDRRGLRDYFIVVATFFSIIAIINWISIAYVDQVLKIDSLFNVIAGLSFLPQLISGLWSVVVLLLISDFVLKESFVTIPSVVRIIWLLMLCTVIAVVAYVLYDANIAGNGERYGSLQQYLVISDSWGTNRGYIWRIAMENYEKFTPFQKLFGHGPDTFGIVTVNSHYNEMLNKYNLVFETAHNEYLQYLITTGVMGLSTYLLLLASSGMKMVKRAFGNEYVMAMFFAFFCYSIQAVVNLNLPVVTPYLWLIMAMGVACCRRGKSTSV